MIPPDDFLKRLRKAIERRTTLYLWVKGDTPPFRPALLPRIYGDGRALFAISTINQRPRYYVIQGDSRWSADFGDTDRLHFGEFVDDILTNLEEHFGNARCGYSGNNLYHPKRERILDCQCHDCSDGSFRARWPMVDADDGCSWGSMDWPAGFETVRNPNTPLRGNLLAYQNPLSLRSTAEFIALRRIHEGGLKMGLPEGYALTKQVAQAVEVTTGQALQLLRSMERRGLVEIDRRYSSSNCYVWRKKGVQP